METDNTQVVENVVDAIDTPIDEGVDSSVGENLEPSGDHVTDEIYRRASQKASERAGSESKPAEDQPAAKQVEEKSVNEEKPSPPETEAKQDELPKGLDPTGRGPNSWKPAVREKFKSLPAEVQSEVLRRENEHQKLMAETTHIRKFGDEFFNAYRPYEAYLNSTGVHPIAAFKDLLNTAYTLKIGDSATKGKLVADIIKANNVDLSQIDQALSGAAEQVDPRTAELQKELNQLKQWRTQQENQQAQLLNRSVEQQVQDFAADPSNEFFHDVVQDMQVLLTNGRAETLKDAYAMACRMNPDVYSVIQARSAPPVSSPASHTPTVQQKIAASSGVKGAPASMRATPPRQLTGVEAAMAAWDLHAKKTRA